MVVTGLVQTTCITCGVRFGIDELYMTNQLMEGVGGRTLKDGDTGERCSGWFYCPNGHVQRYTASRSQKIGERNVELSRKLESVEAENEQLKATVDRLEKLHHGHDPVAVRGKQARANTAHKRSGLLSKRKQST